MTDILIQGGEVVTSEGRFDADVAIADGQIVEVATDLSGRNAETEIDASSKLVMPGAIDGHTHVEWPDWDFDYGAKHGGQAAPVGGVTTFFNFVFAEPGKVWERYEEMRAALENNSRVDFALHVGVFTLDDIAMVPDFVEEGITSFKLLLPYRGEEVVEPAVGIDDGIVYKLMEQVADLNVPAWTIVHPENVEPSFKIKDEMREEGKAEGAITWDSVRPDFLELDAINRLALFANETGCPTHLAHMSSRRSVDLLRQRRADSDVPLTAEVQTQYLTEDARDHDLLAKVNPPIRTSAEHSGLWNGISEGTIKFMSSDHAPCATKHKQNIWDATVGIPNLQTWFPNAMTAVLDDRPISLPKFVEVTSHNPAEHYGLMPRKGGLWPGSDADVIVVDPDSRKEVHAEDLYHQSDFTPFEGKEMVFPEITIARGEIVQREGQITAEAGRAEFLPRPIEQ